MKKSITALILILTMVFSTATAFANSSDADMEDMSIKLQVAAMIASVDMDLLLSNASEGVIDYTVPIEVRESIVGSVDIVPISSTSKAAIEYEMNTTIQKVGEIVVNDDIATLYVAATGVKIDERSNSGTSSIWAWASVYWIDNFGVDNEFVGAQGTWSPGNTVISGRSVRYGKTDILGIGWSDDTTKYPTDNVAYYDSGLIGLTFKCQAKVTVVNIGTVTVTVCNSLFT